eukprot:CAMPEP_0181335656 /NCGR_PEP_ID=MMETSP1101-20121128/26960_1 /TAXON_ID=46948 /ORGANISM="Rhodomonas abbreviata, Strain Caron Lab Isolate" /LENGTH=120 /DNA_ID=CAMNT_0023445815 /DNA_START=52 /DNA_END=411 /DNA_ORIENTATION=-
MPSDLVAGDLVWSKAKVKDEWWPCQKCDVPDGSNGTQDLTPHIKLADGEHCVFFFGTKNFGKVKLIEKFEDKFEEFSKKTKRKPFLNALADVELYQKGEPTGAPHDMESSSPGSKGKDTK